MRTSQQFTEWLLAQNRTPATVRNYRSDLRMFSQWFEQTKGYPFVTPEQLRTAVVQEYKQYMVMEVNRKASTINRQLAALGTYSRWAQAMGLLDHNPAEAVRTVAIPKQTTRWLSSQEQTALQKEVSGLIQLARTPKAQFLSTRNQAIVLVVLNSGLRIGEVCELNTNNLHIATKNGHIQIQLGEGIDERTILLNAQATETLDAWLNIRLEWLDMPGSPENHVFVGQQGFPIQTRNIQKMITKLGNRIGMKLTWRVLRHTFAKNLIKAGVSLEEVAAILGYKNVSAARTYVSPDPQDIE